MVKAKDFTKKDYERIFKRKILEIFKRDESVSIVFKDGCRTGFFYSTIERMVK